MQAEHGVVDDGGDGQHIEDRVDRTPHGGALEAAAVALGSESVCEHTRI